MEPDSTTLLLSIAAGVATLPLAYFVGRVSADDEKDGDNVSRLGFSDALAGLMSVFIFVCGFFATMLLRVLPAAWWLAVCAVPACMVWALCFALGRSAQKEPGKYTTAGFLGRVFTLPAKGVFRAAKISVEDNLTEKDVLNMMDDVEEQDMIDGDQKEMITNIFSLDDVSAGDIMTHRTEMVCVPVDMTATDAINISLENGVSRMPVYEKSVDDIVGILYVKDLLVIVNKARQATARVKSFMRPVMFVPETCRAQDLLVEFRKKHTQIAIVVDEYGGTGGIVTMEDVLEEIVGNIQDEFDNEEEELQACDDGSIIAAGEADLEDVLAAFGKEPPAEYDSEDFDSVGGMMIDRLGRIPAAGEDVSVEYDGIRFTVLEVGERRIMKVRCEMLPAEEEEQ